MKSHSKGHSKSSQKSSRSNKSRGSGKKISFGFIKSAMTGVTKSATGAPVPSSYAQQQRAVQRVTAKALRVSTRTR